MLNNELEFSLNLAFREARDRRHEFFTVEHLLLALIGNPTAAQVLKACNADLTRLKKEIEKFIDQTTPLLLEGEDRETLPTLGFQRVLQRAVFNVQSAGKAEVNGANVLVSLFGEADSQAVFLLHEQNITRLDIVNFIAHGVTKTTEESAGEGGARQPRGAEGEPGEAAAKPLQQFATNLNERAAAGKIDPLVGRDPEIERTLQILCRRRKNNPLLVGEAGVGKTAIAEGLAKRIVEKNVPDILAESVIYSLDLGAMVAGTKYRGDFEKRMKALLNHLREQPHAILFIDEIHTMIGAGSASGGVMDASNLIKPMLANGDLKCIGSTTYSEFRSIFEKDKALARRFQKVDIEEPTINETVQILRGLKSRYEEHHHVSYTLGALKSAAELSARFITDRFLPDKAIDVIDEAGALQKMKPSSKKKKKIGSPEIEDIVARMARVPVNTVSSSDKELLQHLERNLKMVIFGQDHAIEMLSSAIKMSRSGLGNPQKPIGSFLFAGPTGVGKTELSRQLALALGIHLQRLDMSEYMESHTISRLIGAPPGYVGFEQKGLLTDSVMNHPHSLVLLDEIEKAHPDIFNVLLQVMDHGTLTDNNGRQVNFRNVILIMTTNAGAEQMSRTSIGFSHQDHSSDGSEAVKKLFTPEFRNRLDGIIQFGRLDAASIAQVVDKLICELEVQLNSKQVTLAVEPSARQWLATRGYDPVMGARPMARLIQDKLRKPLAEAILFGELHEGGHVQVNCVEDELVLEFCKEGVTA
jgi:ATP-dependent Clp protease ATP-binding subunit ClpA